MDTLRIFHIADLHIFERSYTNLISSAKVLAEKIREHGVENSLLVILGDVFEFKVYLNTGDIQCFNDLLDIWAGIKIFIIPGNHDINLSAAGKDNISVLLEPGGRNRELVKCFPETGNYNIGSIYSKPEWNSIWFCFFSPIDGKEPDISELPSSDIKIALLHETILNCSFYNGITCTSARYSASAILAKGYSGVFLGDIHKPQFLGSKKNAAYPGSFVQKDMGEGLQHGYIAWTVAGEQITGKFYRIPLKEVYLTIEASPSGFCIDKAQCSELPELESSIRCLTLKHSGLTPEQVLKSCEKIQAAYGCINRIHDVGSTSVKDLEFLTSESASGKHEIINSEAESFVELFNETASDAAKALHRTYSEKKSKNHARFSLQYLKWSNLFSYGEGNYLDFRDFSKNIIIIQGDNEIGKSSVIEIITKMLFDRCDCDSKYLINKRLSAGTKASAEISILVNGKTITIKRSWFINGVAEKHELLENGKPITKESIKSTYKFLQSEIGLGSYDDFVNISLAKQERRSLVYLKNSELTGIISSIMDFDYLSDIFQFANLDTKRLKKRMADLQIEMSSISLGEKIDTDFLENKSQMLFEKKMKLSEELAVVKSRIPDFNIRAEALSLKRLINTLQAQINELPKAVPSREKSVCDYLSSKLSRKISSISQSPMPSKFTKAEIKQKLSELKNINIQVVNLPKNIASIKTDLQLIRKQVHESTTHFSAFTPRELRSLLKCETRVSSRSLEDINQEVATLESQIKGFSRIGNYAHEELLVIKRNGITAFLKSLNFTVPQSKQAELEAELALLPDLLEMKKKYNMLNKMSGSGLKFSQTCNCCAANSTTLQSAQLELQKLASIIKQEPQFLVKRKELEAGLEVAKTWNAKARDIQSCIENDLEWFSDKKKLDEIYSLKIQAQTASSNEEILASNQAKEINALILETCDNMETMKLLEQQELYSQQLESQKTANDLLAGLKQIYTEELQDIISDVKLHAALEETQALVLQKNSASEKLSQFQELIELEQKYMEALKTMETLNQEITQNSKDLAFAQSRKLQQESEQERFDKLSIELSVCVEDFKTHEEYCNLINPDSGIPRKLMENICRSMESRINAILVDVANFTLSIMLEGSHISLFLKQNRVVLPVKSGSGFQKFLIDLLLRVVLSQCSVLSIPDFLIIDEGFGCLDRKNFGEIAKILKLLKSKYSAILIITHIEELKAYGDLQIGIKKLQDSGNSYLCYGSNELQEKQVATPIATSHLQKFEALTAEERMSSLVKINEGVKTCACCDIKLPKTIPGINKHIMAKKYKQFHAEWIYK